MRTILIMALFGSVLAIMARGEEPGYRPEDGYFYAGWYWETKGKDKTLALRYYRAYLREAGEAGTFTARAHERIAVLDVPLPTGPCPRTFKAPGFEERRALEYRALILRRDAGTRARKGYPYQAARLNAQAAYWTARADIADATKTIDAEIRELEAALKLAHTLERPLLAVEWKRQVKLEEREQLLTRAGLTRDLAFGGLTALHIELGGAGKSDAPWDVAQLLCAARRKLKVELAQPNVSDAESRSGTAFLKRLTAVIDAHAKGDVENAQRLADAEWTHIMAFKLKD